MICLGRGDDKKKAEGWMQSRAEDYWAIISLRASSQGDYNNVARVSCACPGARRCRRRRTIGFAMSRPPSKKGVTGVLEQVGWSTESGSKEKT